MFVDMKASRPSPSYTVKPSVPTKDMLDFFHTVHDVAVVLADSSHSFPWISKGIYLSSCRSSIERIADLLKEKKLCCET
ncbi:hypothetical protein HPP92_022895 [Vanilla planifolia]|uniref:Uncharacterized protein n=1 Tax=Vanilla planifolia TaxID=51239 RepID=A0A835PRR2_VANPL|nr:hypothetical protein HPP92_022895 [Vanilla planifolia]